MCFLSMEEGEEEVVIAGDAQCDSNLGCEGATVIQGVSPYVGNNWGYGVGPCAEIFQETNGNFVGEAWNQFTLQNTYHDADTPTPKI